MTPRRSIIGAAIRKLVNGSDYGLYPDPYWPNTVLAMRMNNEVDKHWSKTSLLLKGNGANNGVVFTDEKGHTVTRAGSLVTSTAAFKFGTASLLFNGTTDYLSASASIDFGLGTDNYTAEAWVKTATVGTITDLRTSATDYGLFYIAAGGFPAHDTPTSTITSSVSVTDNSWHHVVFCRVSSILTIFVDGVITAVAACNLDLGSSRPIRIGATYTSASFFNGYLDDVRLTKGVGRYVGEFTPPKSPMLTGTAIQLQDETYLNTMTGYSIATNTSNRKYGNASLELNGSSAYANTPDSPSFNFGAADFTIECWTYLNAAPTTAYAFIGHRTSDTAGIGVALYTDSAPSSGLSFSYNGTTFNFCTVNEALPTGVWLHLAACRSGSEIMFFINGVLKQTTSVGTNALFDSPASLSIGSCNTTPNYFLNGYIDDVRITKGVARYPASFAPPTRELSNYGVPIVYDPYWDSVVLGMHMDGADNGVVFTEVKGKTVTVVGSTKTVTATKKFGTASGSFDGSGDKLTLAASADWNLGTTYTIEFWANPTSLPGAGNACRLLLIGANASTDALQVFFGPSGEVGCGIPSSGITSFGTGNGVMTTGSFNHYAMTCDNGIGRVFKNGVMVGGPTTGITPQTGSSSAGLIIGFDTVGTVNYNFQGYIDDLRITKGVARYVANFQPYQYAFPEVRTPVKPIVDKYYDNVVLNMHMDGANTSAQFIDEKGKAVTVVGNAQIGTGQSKFGGSSALFDGTGDYLSLAGSVDFKFLTDDFTIECWLKTATQAEDNVFLDYYLVGSNGWQLFVKTTGEVIFYESNPNAVALASSRAVADNSWHHVAVCRLSGVLMMFIDGALSGSVANTKDHSGDIPLLTIGAQVNTRNATYDFNGYIDDLRITKGVSRYSSPFTIPALPNPNFKVAPELQDPHWQSVVLSMNMEGTNGGVTFTDVKGHAMTAGGNAVTSSTKSRFGSTAAYFDGTSDFISTPASADFQFGTGDFTLECWVNHVAATGGTVGNDKHIFGNFAYNPDMSFALDYTTLYPLMWDGTARHTSSIAVPPLTWTHIAWSRSAGILKIFVNGIQSYSGTCSVDFNSTAISYIGSMQFDNTRHFQGYMDDLRITKGIARYTGNFAVPVLPSPVV